MRLFRRGFVMDSRKPSLTPLIKFQVLVGLLLALNARAQIKALHIFVVPKLVGIAIQHDTTVLHNVAVIGDRQSEMSILLHQQDRRLLL